MWQDIISGLILASISGIIGFFIKSKYFQYEIYAPFISNIYSEKSYSFIEREWFAYNLTIDPKLSNNPIVGKSKINLKIQKNLVVTGEDEIIVDHRRRLKYRIRGQINSGRFFYTGIGIDDTSDVYTVYVDNLLDNKFVGIIVAQDYERKLFSGPIFFSEQELDEEKVLEFIMASSLRFLCTKKQFIECKSI